MPTLHSNNPVPSNGSVATVIRGAKSISMTLSGVGAIRAVVQIMSKEDGADDAGRIGSPIVVSGTTTVTTEQTFNAEAGQVYLQLIEITPACKFSATLTDLGPIQDTNPGSPSNPFASTAARNAATPFPANAVAYVSGSPVPTPYMLANGATGASDADWIASSFFNSPGPGTFRVRWIDYTGEVVQTLYCDSGASFAHPAAPTHAGLTFDAWSQDALLITADRDIYANYYATDGKAHLLVDASALAGLTPTIKVAKSDTSTLLIEWGDGTTSTSSDSGNVTVVKPAPYAAGSYDIKLSISVGTGTFAGGHGTSGNPLIAGVAATEMWMRASSTTVTGYAFNGPAFRTMRYMTGLGGITSIGASAFQNCFALVSAIMPSVTSIGASAFQNCYALVSAIMPSATSIGANAFSYCFALVSAIMPSVTSIGNYAFQNCYALVSAIMPLATSIGASAFQNCFALVSAIMPLATSIGATAFQYCRLLASVIIGPNCTLIDALAFDGCRLLRSLTVQATTPPTLASVATIADYDPRMLIYVPTGSAAAYQSATNWSAFSARIGGY